MFGGFGWLDIWGTSNVILKPSKKSAEFDFCSKPVECWRQCSVDLLIKIKLLTSEGSNILLLVKCFVEEGYQSDFCLTEDSADSYDANQLCSETGDRSSRLPAV